MLKINELSRLHLGVKQENLSRTIEIDMSAWALNLPNATAVILHKRHGDQTKYLTGATYDSDTMLLSWTPTQYDTYYEGWGVAEIRMVEGEVIKKTKDMIITAVCPSVIDGTGEVVASDYQAFLDSVIGVKQEATQAKNDAEDAAEDAAESAEAAAASAALVDHYPIVNEETGKWALWHIDHYEDTAYDATGPTPDIAIGTVETLQPDEQAYVELDESSTPEMPVFNFGLPKGEPGSVDNVYGTTIDMSSSDSTKVATAIGGKADKVTGATSGNFAGLDANGNLTDSGSAAEDFLTQQDITGKLDKDQGSENAGKFMKVGSDGELVPDAVPDPTGKADKVTGATSGNFAGLDANGNLTDSGHKHSDYLTQQDITGKVDVFQGLSQAGKALGIGNDGNVTPVPFSGDDFTGATASTAGVHGYVPAPAAGEQAKVLTGGGTWEISPGAKVLTVELTTITNVSGSYTGTTSDERISSDMKPIMLILGTPSAIRAKPTVTCNNGSITFTCSDVEGTTTATVSVIKVIDDPTAVTSSEFDILNNRIGDLDDLTTTAQGSAVDAINELDGDIDTINTSISTLNGKITTVATISTGITGIYARKMGKLVKLYIHDFNYTNTSVGTLPDSLKPESITYCPIINDDSTSSRMIKITSSGQITGIGTVTSGYFYGSIMYFANS